MEISDDIVIPQQIQYTQQTQHTQQQSQYQAQQQTQTLSPKSSSFFTNVPSLTPTRPQIQNQQKQQSLTQIAKQLKINKNDDVDITAYLSESEIRKLRRKEKKEKTFNNTKPLEINTADKIDQEKTAMEKLNDKYQTIEQKTDKLLNEMIQKEQQQQTQQQKQQNQEDDDSDSIQHFKKDLLSKNIIKHPKITLQDVAGMDKLKTTLRTNVLAKIKFNLTNTANTILLYSLPGCGKTYIAQAIAGSAKLPLITATPSDLISKWQGESEKLVRALFEICNDYQPCILFLDEFDSLAIERGKSDNESSRRIKNELLQQMDKMPQKVTLIAATNRPFDIDSAIRRRFSKRIFVELPDEKLRKSIFEKHFQQFKEQFENYDEILQFLVQQTQKFSNSDVVTLAKKVLQTPQDLYINAGRYRMQSNGKYVIDPNGEEHDCLEFDDSQIQFPMITMDMVKTVKINKSINIKEENRIRKFEVEYGNSE